MLSRMSQGVGFVFVVVATEVYRFALDGETNYVSVVVPIHTTL
jgi:hypothetical protein